MSITKPSHRRDNSGELDVFEAARYFSGYSDNFALVGGPNVTPKMLIKEEKEGYNLRVGRRISLDMPSLRQHHYNHPISKSHHHQFQQQQQQQIKEKKYKQPNSPGGKLAHFLNSLFNQTSSKKKKSLSKSSTLSLKDEDESPSGRRKRRSSISHFWSSTSVDSKSIYSSSSSGFRTPQPSNNNLSTPIKTCKEFRSFSEHKDFLATLSKLSNNGNENRNGSTKKDEKMRSTGSKLNWVDEKIKSKSGIFEKPKSKYNHGYLEKNRGVNKFHEELDDGADSDSSSDLFELQIDYGFGFCSSGLPVYETTHMDSIKRSSSTAITNGPMKN